MEPYQPILHTFPKDPLGRFRVLREFLRRWHDIDTGSAGHTCVRIDDAEARAGTPLPLGIREWIAFLDDLHRVCQWSNVLRDCWSLDKVRNHKAFSLLVAGEGDRHWAVLLKDLEQEDPPVYAFVPDYDVDERQFVRGHKEAPHVSTWAVEFILLYLYLSRSVQCEVEMSINVFEKFCKKPGDGIKISKIGKTSVVEFSGGLIVAEKRGKLSYRLKAYAPNLSESHNDYYKALHGFRQRLRNEMGLPFS